MKNLKDCIKNYVKDCIVESIWDIEDNVDSDNKEFILNEVKRFIKDNYANVDLKRLTFVFNKKKGKYIVNLKGSVTGARLNTASKSIVNDLFEWGKVEGWFDCSHCPITTLQGAPETVGGTFYCPKCSITSLKGAPKTVGGNFYCYTCPNLTSLEGVPEYVRGNFYCHECNELKTLKGAPKKVGGIFSCTGCPITSLKDSPEEVGGFNCAMCKNLKSLEGVPEYVGDDVNCYKCEK